MGWKRLVRKQNAQNDVFFAVPVPKQQHGIKKNIVLIKASDCSGENHLDAELLPKACNKYPRNLVQGY